MADIRIEDLPLDASPAAGDFLPIDGATTRKTTIQAAVEIGRPVASQAEAEAGVNNTKVMTPLTTLQSLTVNAASPTQGAKADTALQPGDIGVSVQGFDALLQAVAALVTVADRLIYTTGVDTVALTELTGFARTLLDDADAAAARATLGLNTAANVVSNTGGASAWRTATGSIIGTDVQAQDALLQSIAGLTVAAGGFLRTSAADTAVAQAIVGTVSQSGGTPTGAIIERGSNANGEYVRFADGTQICWLSLADSTGAETASGSSFQNAADITWTFPATFNTGVAPVVVEGSLVRSDRIGGVSFRSSPGSTNVAFRYWATTSIAAGASVTLRLFAIGRWF